MKPQVSGFASPNRIILLGWLLLGQVSLPGLMHVAAHERVASAFDSAAVERVANPPRGLPAVQVPESNPLTPSKVGLGRDLFFDRRLSRNRTMSCAMCHLPEQGFTSNEMATPIGVKGASLQRNAPTLLNVAYRPRLFLDLREDTLEQQVLGPLFSPEEMANPSVAFVLETVRAAPEYLGRFEAVFGRPADLPALTEALASYERTLLAGDSAFDRWRSGDAGASFPAAAKRGFALFTGRAGCAACHLATGDHPQFTDERVHNIGAGDFGGATRHLEISPGIPAASVMPAGPSRPPRAARDLGRMGITDDPRDLRRFRTPSLRNVALTAPYMHDGSLRTLEEVILFYANGGKANPNLDPLIKPVALDARDVSDLQAFLKSLTSTGMSALVEDARSTSVRN